MNCYLCQNACQAGNQNLVGCCYWTAIFRGHTGALKTALESINQEKNFGINLDSTFTDPEAIAFLIDILIEDYAPKPLYTGWANLNLPYNLDNKRGDMIDSCIVVIPRVRCRFFKTSESGSEDISGRAKNALNRMI